ncbi:hypothetical protein [Archangium sp.]|jgi:hypothetical protein|uniref:hypothetical protein n=1 Tax=Archangium sp. TaxID=1872627 RepID=UPI002ED9C1EB
MIGFGLTLIALLGTFVATRRGTGHGLGVLMLFGYFYGILRARYLDGFSHFIFDGAVVGLYLAFFTRRKRAARVGRDGVALRLWVKVLMLWPLFTLVLSPFLDSQHFFIQIVGLRVAILLLPFITIGASLDEKELDTFGTWVLWLNAVAFVFALAELRLGVEPFFPRNASSQIIYNSTDVGEERLPRIPSIFNSAHAYAGTMLMSLPMLVRRWIRVPKDRLLTTAMLVASVLGIFISAARSPVAQLALTILLLLVVSRFSMKMLASVLGLGLVVGLVVMTNERFQRFLTLQDTSYVSDRMVASVNESLTNVLLNYPMGSGLGSAAGTSIPFFLMDLARPQIGLENEFGRIALEQGLPGLMLWLCFLGWLATRLPPRRRGAPVVADRMMWVSMLVMWMTAFLGTGTLSSIPGSALLLLWMGAVVGMRRPAPAKAPVPATPPRVGPLEVVRP